MPTNGFVFLVKPNAQPWSSMLRIRKPFTQNMGSGLPVFTTFRVAQCHKSWSIYFKGWCVIIWGNFQEGENHDLPRDNWAREQSIGSLAGIGEEWGSPENKISGSATCFGKAAHELCTVNALPLSTCIFVSWAKHSQQPLVHPRKWLKVGESSDWMIKKLRENFAALSHASSWEPERKDSLWFTFGLLPFSQS